MKRTCTRPAWSIIPVNNFWTPDLNALPGVGNHILDSFMPFINNRTMPKTEAQIEAISETFLTDQEVSCYLEGLKTQKLIVNALIEKSKMININKKRTDDEESEKSKTIEK